MWEEDNSEPNSIEDWDSVKHSFDDDPDYLDELALKDETPKEETPETEISKDKLAKEEIEKVSYQIKDYNVYNSDAFNIDRIVTRIE